MFYGVRSGPGFSASSFSGSQVVIKKLPNDVILLKTFDPKKLSFDDFLMTTWEPEKRIIKSDILSLKRENKIA